MTENQGKCKYKGIDKEQIKKVAEVKFGRHRFGEMDLSALNQNETFKLMEETVEKYQQEYMHDMEMSAICELAMMYLNNIENKENYDKCTYENGMFSAWETMQEIICTDSLILVAIFGKTNPLEIIQNFTPQEAVEKIDNYKKDHVFNVGDVVVTEGCVAVIMDQYSEEHFSVLTENGCVEDWCRTEMEKTGRTIDISGILKELQEAGEDAE